MIFNVMKLFDSHAHLQDDRIRADHEAIIARAEEAGVAQILCCGSSEADWDQVAFLADRYPSCVIPAFGLHPLFYRSRSVEWLLVLEKMLCRYQAAAIGEIGLDHSIQDCDRADMLDVFVRQISLAQKLGRPVSIHCRNAWEPLENALNQSVSVSIRGAVHSWSGSAGMLARIMKFGLYISFSAALTNDKNRRSRESALAVPLDRMLVETDSPDLVPFMRNGLNEPSFITDVVKKIADIRELSPEYVARVTYENGMLLFRK